MKLEEAAVGAQHDYIATSGVLLTTIYTINY